MERLADILREFVDKAVSEKEAGKLEITIKGGPKEIVSLAVQTQETQHTIIEKEISRQLLQAMQVKVDGIAVTCK